MDGHRIDLLGDCFDQPVRVTACALALRISSDFYRVVHSCYTTRGMTESYCNVALPVPLRTTFTYAVPDAMREQVQPGSRVLVPFRKKAMVGVVVEMTATVPEGTKIREIHKVLDLIPALTPKLLELGQWIANYYLAPVGEVFRAMLASGRPMLP